MFATDANGACVGRFSDPQHAEAVIDLQVGAEKDPTRRDASSVSIRPDSRWAIPDGRGERPGPWRAGNFPVVHLRAFRGTILSADPSPKPTKNRRVKDRRSGEEAGCDPVDGPGFYHADRLKSLKRRERHVRHPLMHHVWWGFVAPTEDISPLQRGGGGENLPTQSACSYRSRNHAAPDVMRDGGFLVPPASGRDLPIAAGDTFFESVAGAPSGLRSSAAALAQALRSGDRRRCWSGSG